MADSAIVPNLVVFNWSRPGAPNPRLARPLSTKTATTAYFTSAPQYEDGTVITDPFIFAYRNKDGYIESIYAPNGANGANGLSATGLIRGVDLAGLDFSTANTNFQSTAEQGSPVFCVVHPVMHQIIRNWIRGTGNMASGGTTLTLGRGQDETLTVQAYDSTYGVDGFFRRTGTKVQFKNPGGAWTNIDDVSASDLVKVSANDTTPGYLNGKIVAGDNTTITENNDGGNETIQINASGPLADIVDDVTATATEINDALDGISANVTAANLSTLNDGGSADGLHSHNNPTLTLFAYEALTADDAAALLPIEVQYYAQLTDANLALGDSNTRRRYAIKFVPSETTATLTTMQFRAAEAVNGATALGDLTISIQTDNSGEPSGTPVANGTANVIPQATQRTWNTTQANRTATWASPPTLTAGTVYWLVFEVASTDGTNYLNLSVNSSHNENYLTFTRLTYDLDTATWGSSTTSATPFFWFNSQPVLLGMGLCKTDASWGARTWNFIGFAKATVSEFTNAQIYYDIVPGLTLTRNKNYYLSETAGAITTTPPVISYNEGTEPTRFTYKIGRSISGTTLKIEKGEKRVLIRETTTISATTTRNYLFWFPIARVRVDAGGGTSSTGDVLSRGYILPDGAGFSVGHNASAGLVSSTSVSLSTIDGGSNFSGAASNVTDVGFTFTLTETSTATLNFIAEAIGQ